MRAAPPCPALCIVQREREINPPKGLRVLCGAEHFTPEPATVGHSRVSRIGWCGWTSTVPALVCGPGCGQSRAGIWLIRRPPRARGVGSWFRVEDPGRTPVPSYVRIEAAGRLVEAETIVC